MADETYINPAAELLNEILRLRLASDESVQRFVEHEKRIAALEAKLQARLDAAKRITPE